MQYSPPAHYQGAPRQSHVPRVLDPSVINEAFPVPVERPFRGKYKLVDTNAEKVMQKLLPSAVYWRGGSYGSVFRVPVSSDMRHYRDTLRFSVRVPVTSERFHHHCQSGKTRVRRNQQSLRCPEHSRGEGTPVHARTSPAIRTSPVLFGHRCQTHARHHRNGIRPG